MDYSRITAVMNLVLSRRNQRLLAGFLVIVLGLVLRSLYPSMTPAEPSLPHNVSFEATTTLREVTVTSSSGVLATSSRKIIEPNATVVRVVDGDTIEVRIDGDASDEKVRLLGVNTPETVDPRRAVQCFGKQASDFTKALLTGKRVRLDSDPQADERDKYHRLLRNIVLLDGTDVNASLVRSGYAYAYVSFPLNKARKKELLRFQEEAKMAKRGLWAEGTCNGQKELLLMNGFRSPRRSAT